MQQYHDTLPCGLLGFNDDGHILDINATLCSLLGYERADELKGQHLECLLSAGGRVFYQTHLFPLLRLQGEVEEIYLSLRSESGGDVPFLLNGRRREGERGVTYDCVLMRTRQRTHFETELMQAKKSAQMANKAKDEFLAALSHELRTPLTPILMVATSMELDSELPLRIRELAGIIRSNAELEARLIDDLLDHTRIMNGKVNLVLAPVDMHALLGTAAEIVRSDASVKQVSITFDCQASAFYVNGDCARLHQVIWNVVKNGVKFTPVGGAVQLCTSNDASGRLILRISDNGIGVAPEHLGRIFNALEQGSISTRQYGGLGLGLAITRGLVERHGGRIWAESEGPGKGTTIAIELATIAAPAEVSPAVAAASISQGTLRLLLVEDHESTRNVLCLMLRKIGHEVHAAATGAEALAAATKVGHLDVLLSDLGLPDQSGYDLLKAIHAVQPQIVAVALSGYGMDEDVQRAKAAGFTAHMVKPVQFAHLRALLDQIPARDRSLADGKL